MKMCWVVMLECGEAEDWQQTPVAIFEEKEEARRKVSDWNRKSLDFQRIFDEFPYCGIDINWIKDMKFTVYETAIPKLSKKE